MVPTKVCENSVLLNNVPIPRTDTVVHINVKASRKIGACVYCYAADTGLWEHKVIMRAVISKARNTLCTRRGRATTATSRVRSGSATSGDTLEATEATRLHGLIQHGGKTTCKGCSDSSNSQRARGNRTAEKSKENKKAVVGSPNQYTKTRIGGFYEFSSGITGRWRAIFPLFPYESLYIW